MSEIPAPALGELVARLAAQSSPLEDGWDGTGPEPALAIGVRNLNALLTAYDAQAARLAAVEQAVNTHQWHVSCCPVLIGALDAVLLGESDGD